MTQIIRGNILRKGELNILYLTDNPYLLEMEDNQEWMQSNYRILFKNISTYLFVEFEKHGVPTHLVTSCTDQLSNIVRKCSMIKLQVKGALVADESFTKYDIPLGTCFDKMIIQMIYKNKHLNYPIISESVAVNGLNLLTENQMETIKKYTYIIENVSQEFFNQVNVSLRNFTIEFGFDCETGDILLCDIFNFQTNPPDLRMALLNLLPEFIN